MINKKTAIFILQLALTAALFLLSAEPTFSADPIATCRDIIVVSEATSTATSTGLEVTYPSIKGVMPVAEGEEVLPIFIKYIFYFGIAISGFVVFGVMVYNGVKVLITAASNPSALEEAKRGIIAGFLGIVLLLGSVLLLNTINPQFTKLTLEKVDEKLLEDRTGVSPGVYLLAGENETEEIETLLGTIKIRKNVYTATKNIPALSAQKFDNKTESVCVNPKYETNESGQLGYYNNAILWDKDDYRGECKIFYRLIGGLEYGVDSTNITQQTAIIGGDIGGDVSSIKVFTRKFFGGEAGKDFSEDFAVKLYKHPGLVDDPEDPNDVCEISSFTQANNPSDIYVKTIQEACPGEGGGEAWTKDQVRSIEVGHGWILATFQEEDNKGRCEVFGSEVVEEIGNRYIGRCEAVIDTSFKGVWKPCISSIAVFKGFLFGDIAK